jgi:4-amino-4-deoxy-L-arabinose transferase-like glycosyltransferase
MSLSPKNTRIAAFLLILVLGAVTRFWGLGWGLPHTYHVDENWFAGKAVQFLKGDLNPHFFHVPTLHMYTLAGMWKAYYGVEKASGRVRTIPEFIDTYNQTPTPFYLMGRALSALMGLGTILLLYLLGKRMFGPRTGAIAALLLIFGLDHTRISHDMLPDVPMVFFLVLGYLFIWNVAEKGRTRDYLWAGAAAGLAMTTKYGGIMLFLPLFIAHVYRVREENRPAWQYLFSPRLIGAGLVFLGVFILGSPYVVLDFPKFFHDFKWQSGHLAAEGHFGDSAEHSSLLFYLRYGFAENIGTISQFFVLGGMAFALLRRQKRDLILLAYPLLQFAMVAVWKSRATRYLFPMAPFFILIGAVFLDYLFRRGAQRFAPAGAGRKRRLLWTAAAALLLAAVIAPSAVQVVKFDAALAGRDSRTRAKDWIEFNIPPGSRIALEMYGPPISRQDYSVLYNHTLGKLDMDDLALAGAEYAVVSDTMAGRFTRFPKDFPKEAAFYERLDREGTLVKTIEPLFREPLIEIHMPQIKIYRLSRAPASGFPVNFRSYAQGVTLTRIAAGAWEIRSTIDASGGLGVKERALNPYVRVTDATGLELARVILRAGTVPSEGTWSARAAAPVPDIPEGAVIALGYEYLPAPSPIAYIPEQPLHKEIRLPAAFDRASREAGRWFGGFWFAAVPGPTGDYFQTAACVPRDKGIFFQSRVFGPALRNGDGRIVDPFVLVRNADGSEAGKIAVFSGRLGPFEADAKGPAENGAAIEGLLPGFRVYFGRNGAASRSKPEAPAGPYLLGLPPLPRTDGS